MFPLVVKNAWYKAYFDSFTIFGTSFIIVFLWRTIRAKIVSSILQYLIIFANFILCSCSDLFNKFVKFYLINYEFFQLFFMYNVSR